jgi:hypothetical protein
MGWDRGDEAGSNVTDGGDPATLITITATEAATTAIQIAITATIHKGPRLTPFGVATS